MREYHIKVLSYWHIPVKIHRRYGIGPGTIPNCSVFLDEYESLRQKLVGN
jgi:hypothetical protein